MSRALSDPVLRAWLCLVGLTVTGTALSVMTPPALSPALGTLLLILAFAKARIILLCYLGLERAPSWRRGALTALAATVLIFTGLFLAG